MLSGSAAYIFLDLTSLVGVTQIAQILTVSCIPVKQDLQDLSKALSCVTGIWHRLSLMCYNSVIFGYQTLASLTDIFCLCSYLKVTHCGTHCRCCCFPGNHEAHATPASHQCFHNCQHLEVVRSKGCSETLHHISLQGKPKCCWGLSISQNTCTYLHQ